MFAVRAGFVGIEFGGRKEEAAVSVIGAFWIEILAAFDEHACVFEEMIGCGQTGGTQCFEYIARHRQIDMARVRRRPPPAAHSPSAINRVGGMPTIFFRELLCAQIRHHPLDPILPPGTPRLAKRTHRQCCRVIGVVRDSRIGHTEHTVRSGIVLNERQSTIHLCLWQTIDRLRDLEERIQHKWCKRLPGAQQAVGMAVPSTVIGLLTR
jgi:hypothetical protein